VGTIKRSISWDPEVLETIDRLVRQRQFKDRSDLVNFICREATVDKIRLLRVKAKSLASQLYAIRSELNDLEVLKEEQERSMLDLSELMNDCKNR